MATLKQLKTFLTVADTLQMSEAVRLLYLSQSTVSQTILDLEREFSAVLFQRSARQLTLTPQGAVLLEYACQVVERYAQLHRAMEKTQAQRELRLGATLTIGDTLVASVLRRLQIEHPDIRPFLYVENTRLLETRLLHNEADLCLIEGIVTSDKLAKLPLVEDVLEITVRPAIHSGGGRRWSRRNCATRSLFCVNRAAVRGRSLKTPCAWRKFPSTLWASRPAARLLWSW